MKKKIIILLALLAVLACTLVLVGCNTDDTPPEPETYTIQYTDDAGLHTLTVTSGAVYSLEALPERYGYEFLGLFDAKTGGTQYIDETGSSLSAFTDNKNLVLFPQFKAREYTLVFDYQGAEVTGTRSLKVSYGSEILELPMNLAIEHKVFQGWYTEAEGKGTQIADKQGVLPANNKVKESVFDLTNKDGNIFLYAYFTTQTHTVTFYAEDNNNPEVITVDYGTDIKNVSPTARVNGQGVLVWSKSKNDTNKEFVFTGIITDDLILYAAEYAPVIDFDENGGEALVSLVARADTAIELPTPTRENYKFIEWQDENGEAYSVTVMPEESITVKAVWQPKLVFDENGGTEVLDISKPAGEAVELPTPTKEGYIFAGWYNSDKEKYTASAMPTVGIALKAGWYEKKTTLVNKVSGDNYIGGYDNTSVRMTEGLSLNLSEYLPDSFNGTVTINAHLKIRHTSATLSSPQTVTLYFYKTDTVSDNGLIFSKDYKITSNSYADFEYSFTTNLNGNVIYGANKISIVGWNYAYISDYYFELTYPDTTKLHL